MQTDKKINEWVEEFILYKQNIGYAYIAHQFYLRKYMKFIEENRIGDLFLTKKSISDFLSSITDKPGNLYNTTAVIREFSRYMIKHGYQDAYIIPPKTATLMKPEPPYFFTKEEIKLFFKKLDSIEYYSSFKGRELVMPALFRVLYCCGLRCKEARTLLCRNVNLSKHYIDVVQSKGGKSRRLFISYELNEYLQEYENRINLIFPRREYFFPHGEKGYSSSTISRNFKMFWKKAFPDFVITTRPRAYDFRHHFAIANLNRWAVEGLDVNTMLAYLMKYMGHQNIRETLYYFHFIPEFFPTFSDMSKPLESIIPEVYDEEE